MSAVFGMFNGIVSTKLGVQAFIVTLASMSVARGIARFWSGGQGVPIAYGTGPGQADPLFRVFSLRIFSTETFIGIPVPAIVFLSLAVIFSILLKYSRFGRHVYAVGGNETSAFLSGVKVDQLKIMVFTLCSFLAGIAGILHAAQQRQGSPNDGAGYELDAIAAVAIGGTSMAGGKGTVVGTVVGALILGILNNMLQLNNVDNNLQLVLKGFIIVVAVVLQRERKK
jgi:ribose transport system permease protein